mgnify:CR=1 FL=1
MKSLPVAYVLWAIGGIYGIHRFYLGQVALGLLYLFTGGLCGIGWLIDAFLIPGLVEEANMGTYHQMQGGWAGQVRHGFRPTHQPRAGGPGILTIFGVIFLGMIMTCFMCMGLSMALGFKKAWEDQEWSRIEKQAELEKERADLANPDREVGEDDPLPPPRVNSPELEQLRTTHYKVRSVIKKKLDPTIARMERERDQAIEEVKRLRPKVKESKTARFKAKKYIEEIKEIKTFLKRLRLQRDRYEQESVSLEMAMRKIERHLEMKDVLGDDTSDEMKRLVARGEALVEEAEKDGFSRGSLEEAVAGQPDAPDEPEEPLEADDPLMDELDAALSEE